VLTTMRNHRGYTLVELLVVMVIMVTVTGGILKLLNTSQRLSRAQAERPRWTS
jgi:prepilin-type N-terminal cleavage/methylation domain-containing protein